MIYVSTPPSTKIIVYIGGRMNEIRKQSRGGMTLKGKNRSSQNNLFPCHSVDHRSHMDRPGIFFSCILYFIRTCVFVLIVLHFAFCLYSHHTTQTSMIPERFEPSTPASDRPQTLDLDRSATGISRD